MIAITTDGASNFKCALKRHGDDYETFEQLMTSLDGDDEELFYLDLDDLQSMWRPIDEITAEDDDIMPVDDNADEKDTESEDTERSETFKIRKFPDKILHKVIDEDDVDGAVLLPSRVDCSAHGFNAIGRNDSFNALKNDEVYAAQYISVFKTLNGIWKANSTRLGRETFNTYLDGFRINKPHRIR